MSTVLNGLLGGFAAGVVATVAVWSANGKLSPVREIASRLGDAAAPSRWLVAAVTVLYGTAAGGLFLLLELHVLGLLAVPPTLAGALVTGIVWGAMLGAVWFVAVRLSGNGSPSGGWRWLIVYHGVYGLAFGLWIRFTWVT